MKSGSKATEIGRYNKSSGDVLCCNCQLVFDRVFNNDYVIVGYIHYRLGLETTKASGDDLDRCKGGNKNSAEPTASTANGEKTELNDTIGSDQSLDPKAVQGR